MPNPPSSKQTPQDYWSSNQDVVIARIVGILCIALGFMMGIHGLEHPETAWLHTALGVLGTGLLAQGYALVRTVTRRYSRDHHQKKP